MPAPETAAKEVRRKPRLARWALRICLGIFLAAIILAFQPLITVYCWLTETPRTQLKFSSEMREPIRNLFEVWETTDDIVHSDSAQMLVDLIGRELPKGATIEDVNEHIRQHYRKGVDIFDGKWSRSNSKGYIFPWLDVKIVRACWNPGDFLEGGSVQVHYVVFEGAYLRTEIQFVGWKGHPHPQIIKIVAVEEPNDGGQVGADQPATALELKAK